jgi:hypothetical protein
MSLALRIAAVSAVLRSLLNDGLTVAGLAAIVGGDVKVTTGPPERVNLSTANDPNQLNLYLYQTSYNQGWRNVAQPSVNAAGQRTSNPPLALDLHYVMTAYGAQDFYAEIILGHAMQVLHEYPVLTASLIQQALSPPALPPGLPKELADSRLAEQVERITITPERLGSEEMSRLWSAMGAKYRMSASYQVTVVLIEGTQSAAAAIPVGGAVIVATPFPLMELTKVIAKTGENTPIFSDSTLILTGTNLGGDDTRILIDRFEFLPANVTPTRIEFPLPAVLPAGFYPGVKGVQVAQAIPLGQPPSQRNIFRSNVQPVVIRPKIVAAAQNVTSTVIDGVTFQSGEIKVDSTPNIGRSQSVTLLLNEFNAPSNRPPNAYSFPAPPENGITNPNQADTPSVVVPFERVLPGSYLVRIQVDGAESVLEFAGGVYATPKVVL